MNTMILNDYHAKIEYDSDIDMFRGEILGLNGSADFYGSTPQELKTEFKNSLAVFLEVCREKTLSLNVIILASLIFVSPLTCTKKLQLQLKHQAKVLIPLHKMPCFKLLNNTATDRQHVSSTLLEALVITRIL